eukprot:SAG11_NODE_6728_length_1258_cov_1.661777_2_plen_183_part_00
MGHLPLRGGRLSVANGASDSCTASPNSSWRRCEQLGRLRRAWMQCALECEALLLPVNLSGDVPEQGALQGLSEWFEKPEAGAARARRALISCAIASPNKQAAAGPSRCLPSARRGGCISDYCVADLELPGGEDWPWREGCSSGQRERRQPAMEHKGPIRNERLLPSRPPYDRQPPQPASRVL